LLGHRLLSHGLFRGRLLGHGLLIGGLLFPLRFLDRSLRLDRGFLTRLRRSRSLLDRLFGVLCVLCLFSHLSLTRLCFLCLAFVHDRQDARDLALRNLQARRVLERTGDRLEAQVEQLVPPLREPVLELVVGQLPQFRCARQKSSSSLFTTFDFTESFWPARRSASFASGSGTPASSNITRPGLITQTQPSGEPFPEPIRVSAGFFVKLLSGKTLIQTRSEEHTSELQSRGHLVCRLLLA